MKTKSILLIDDETTILFSLKIILEKEGYDVYTANSGKKGLQMFLENKPDLIITDLMLNGINGIDLLKHVKTERPEIMVMIITGFGDLNSAIDALKLGAIDYLLKPIKNKELVLRISNCFERLHIASKIKAYEKFVTICNTCKKIRDDVAIKYNTGDWVTIEAFLERHTGISCTHNICPDCTEGDEVKDLVIEKG